MKRKSVVKKVSLFFDEQALIFARTNPGCDRAKIRTLPSTVKPFYTVTG